MPGAAERGTLRYAQLSAGTIVLLLERDAHLEALSALLARASSGRGACALVLGEAGIGKTSLVREFVARTAAPVEVLWGGCEALFQPRPLGPIVDMAPALPPALARSVLAGHTYNDLFPALLAHLRDRRHPRVMVVDDVQWADEATLDCLKYLVRRIEQSHALLVVTARTEEVGPGHPLRRVLGDLPADVTRRIELAPLSAATVERMAEQHGRDARELMCRTGGNPFYVGELLAACGAEIPGSVRDAVLARVARLGPWARRVIDLVSIEPARIERALVADCLGAVAPRGEAGTAVDADARGEAAIREAIAGGVLHECGRWLAFRHEIARLAIAASLTPNDTIELHRVVLARLQQAGDDETLARQVHHARGAERLELVAALAPRAAAQAASVGSHRSAAALYRLALGAVAVMPERPAPAASPAAPPAASPVASAMAQAELLEAAAVELHLTNALAEAIELRERALALRRELADRTGMGANLVALGALSWQVAGERAEYLRLASAAVDVLEPEGGGAALARACATMSHVLCLRSDYDASIAWGERAVTLAEASGDAAARVVALQRHGSARICKAPDPAARAQVERALALAIESRFDDLAAELFVTLQTLALIHHEHEYSLDVGARGIRFCEARDLDTAVAGLLSRRAHSLLQLGRWDEGEREYGRCLAVPDVPALSRESARHALHLLAERRGERVVGREAAAAAATYWRRVHGAIDEQRIGFRPAAIATACAEVAWLHGDVAAAVDVARRGLDAALRARDGRLAGPLLVWLRRCGAVAPPCDLDALDLPAACRRELDGDVDGAADAWKRLQNPYEQALVLACGDAQQKRAALPLLEDLGACRAAQLTRNRLRALGERGLPQGPRRRTRADTHGLTPRERQVFELLRQRLSNAAIAAKMHRSERTVEHHVASVLAKLGVRSRAELPRSGRAEK